MSRRLSLVAVAASVFVAASGPAGAQPLRLGLSAFGGEAQIEVWGLPSDQADAAVRKALLEIHELDTLTAASGGGPGSITALNAAAGQGPQVLDPRVSDLLRRALLFCIWNAGARSPVAGELHRLHRERQAERTGLTPTELRDLARGADCANVAVGGGREGAPLTFSLAKGSAVDVRSLAPAYAVDRAAELLLEHGAKNAIIELGRIRRAFGPGLEGKGWAVEIPPVRGTSEAVDEVYLVDQALAYRFAYDDPDSPILDHRTGLQTRGRVAIVAATSLAVEAQALVETLFVLDRREGERRLGNLQPQPSVMWLVGSESKPVVASHRWTEMAKVRQRRTSPF